MSKDIRSKKRLSRKKIYLNTGDRDNHKFLNYDSKSNEAV